METNARYLTIGGFMLLAITMLLGFILWLNHSDGLAQHQTYRVQFGAEVSGLQPGAAVLFNGMRVGSVSALALDPKDPRLVLATITVAADTPVRRDTRVGIASQGLMGTVAVSLEGGAADAPPATAEQGLTPTLIADPTAGRSLTQSAQETLLRVNGILGDNADALKTTMGNLQTFSAVLARNSERIDAIMTGLAQMTGGGAAKTAPALYDLETPVLAPLTGVPASGQIVIDDPTAVIALQTQFLLVRSPDGALTPASESKWSDTLPKLLQAKLLQCFEDVGLAVSLTPPSDIREGDLQLQLDLRRFDVTEAPSRTAFVSFSAKTLTLGGRVLNTRIFDATAPSEPGEREMIKALNVAFKHTANDLAQWMLRPLVEKP